MSQVGPSGTEPSPSPSVEGSIRATLSPLTVMVPSMLEVKGSVWATYFA